MKGKEKKAEVFSLAFNWGGIHIIRQWEKTGAIQVRSTAEEAANLGDKILVSLQQSEPGRVRGSKKDKRKAEADEVSALHPQLDIPFTESVPHKTKVLVALSGGIDSAIAAFLLKRQGYQLIGLGMVFLDKERIKERMDATQRSKAEKYGASYWDREPRFKKLNTAEFMEGSCSIDQLEQTKAICDRLDIPFYAVNAQSEYEARVLEPLVASRLVGESYIPCVVCNNVKMDILLKKSKILGCDYIATGHYAKVHRSQGGKSYQILSSNDFDYDQSYLLSKLKQQQMSRLVFPLAELRRKDVEKLAEKFALKLAPRRDSNKICFVGKWGLPEYVESMVHDALIRDGAFFNVRNSNQLADHFGLHRYGLGESAVEAKMAKATLNPVDKNMMVINVEPAKGKIFLGYEDDLRFSGCAVDQLVIIKGMDLSRPMTIFVQAEMGGAKVEAFIFFKNNLWAVLEFKKPLDGLGIGKFLTFYNKGTGGAKVIGSGVVSYLGQMALVNRTEDMDRPIEGEEDEAPSARVVKELSF